METTIIYYIGVKEPYSLKLIHCLFPVWGSRHVAHAGAGDLLRLPDYCEGLE